MDVQRPAYRMARAVPEFQEFYRVTVPKSEKLPLFIEESLRDAGVSEVDLALQILFDQVTDFSAGLYHLSIAWRCTHLVALDRLLTTEP